VTGGTQGIGWAMAQALADHGGRVFACGLSERSLARANESLATLPWRESISLAQCDVANAAAFEGWIHGVHGQTGRVDLLINNAAFVRWEDIRDMSIEDARYTMRVSYDALVVGVKTVLPLMEEVGGGHIVNMGSMTARIFVRGSSAAYAAAKAAIDAYTLMLQIELQDSPISVTLVRLGTVAGTDFFRKYVKPERMSPLTRFVPALTPPQVAHAVVRAIQKKQAILTLPGYMHWLSVIYNVAPRFSRWLSQVGGQNQHEYGRTEWQYRRKS